MQGDKQVIEALNNVLMAELTAINIYYKMQVDWGYEKLASHARVESMGEMKHADQMIERILYLDGVPDMTTYDTILVGDTCEAQLKNQYKIETKHVARLQKHIALCISKNDFGSKEFWMGFWKTRKKVAIGWKPSFSVSRTLESKIISPNTCTAKTFTSLDCRRIEEGGGN